MSLITNFCVFYTAYRIGRAIILSILEVRKENRKVQYELRNGIQYNITFYRHKDARHFREIAEITNTLIEKTPNFKDN